MASARYYVKRHHGIVLIEKLQEVERRAGYLRPPPINVNPNP
jgi:hypothetical protein